MTNELDRRGFLKRGGVTLLGSGILAGERAGAAHERDVTASARSTAGSNTTDLLFAVVFEVKPSAAGYQTYLDIAKSLRPALDSIDGFVSVERFVSRTRSGWLLSLSQWADEAALVRWRSQESHHAAQLRGRSGVFDDYRLRVAQVIGREDHDSESAAAWQPLRRSAYNDVDKRVPGCVGVIDLTLMGSASQDIPLATIATITAASQDDEAFLGSEVFESLEGVTPRRLVQLISWRDEPAARRWHNNARVHLRSLRQPDATSAGSSVHPVATENRSAASGAGANYRESALPAWRIAIAEVERDYGLKQRESAPQYMPPVVASVIVQPATSRQHEVFRIPGHPTDVMLALRHVGPGQGRPVDPKRVVLFVHGASFPSALAAGYRFDGHSWMDDLSDAGFDVWALDFAGYGDSDRYLEMSEPPSAHSPLGRAHVCSRQIEAAVRFVRARQRVARVSLIAHSWGTVPTGLYATQEPSSLHQLVLFGPVTLRRGSGQTLKGRDPIRTPSYDFVTVQAQHDRFYGYVPAGEAPVLEARRFEAWGTAYLASDPSSGTRRPPSVQVPFGPSIDTEQAWAGTLAYDPGRIVSPTLVIRGQWDTVTTDADALWLMGALRASPAKLDVVIRRGTHVMHLESSRYQLYQEVQSFLERNS
jgi:pimeloyl-ACP methyl ester carboxylesterase/heme-degrading monooxygenase HmoA